MKIDGDILTIDLNLSMDEIVTLEEFVRPRIEYIERIETEDGSVLSSSALLSLLVSIKKTRPEIEIPFLQKEQTISFASGTVHWTYHD